MGHSVSAFKCYSIIRGSGLFTYPREFYNAVVLVGGLSLGEGVYSPSVAHYLSLSGKCSNPPIYTRKCMKLPLSIIYDRFPSFLSYVSYITYP